MRRVENVCGLALKQEASGLGRQMGKPGWTVCVSLHVCVCPGTTRAPIGAITLQSRVPPGSSQTRTF